jgi:hypothetical protein
MQRGLAAQQSDARDPSVQHSQKGGAAASGGDAARWQLHRWH